MNRKGTLTVPYTFCLFCGVIGLVLLMVGTAVGLAARDIQKARPDQATQVLHQAMRPVTRALAEQLDGPFNQLDLIRHWANRGLLSDSIPTEWPAVILPALMRLPGLKSFALVREDGGFCEVARGADGWTGGGADPAHPDGALARMAWDENGYTISKGRRSNLPGDLRHQDWYKKVLAGGERRAEPIVELSEGGIRIAGSLNFPGGQRGCLALTLDTHFLDRSFGGTPAVEIRLDPGGARLGQIQDSEALALLSERALPGEGFPALAQLFPPAPNQATFWYAVQSHTLTPDNVWWVIARIDASTMPLPALPVFNYAGWSLVTGLTGAVLLTLLCGRSVTRPLRQVAARARSIHLIDEHYVPWPRSRFTEVNVLTSALEDIYETAVEHLDYHDAPLVTWAEPESTPDDGMVDAEAVRHVFQFPRSEAPPADPAQPGEKVIDIAGETAPIALPEAIPAAQLQVLRGTRKELRRLQSQLAGASEELRTADNHYQQDLARVKRQRNCLRGLEPLLLTEGAASPTMLAQVGEVLGAIRVSLWTTGAQTGYFHLAIADGEHRGAATPLMVPFATMSLLQSESLLTIQEPARDPRLAFLTSHPNFRRNDDPQMLAPIRMAGKLLGFIIVERPVGHGRWKGDEELFTLGVAHACAGVLWRQLRQRASSSGTGFTAQIVVHDQSSPKRNGKSAGNGGARRAATSGPTLYWEIDRAGCIKSLDGDVEGLYGHTREQLIGQPITFLSAGEQGARDMEQLAELLAGRRCRGYETCHLAADGARLQLVVRARIWRDASDRIAGARGTLEPVSAAVSS